MRTLGNRQTEVSAESLRDFLPPDPTTFQVVCYESGAYAMRSTVADILTLARYNKVFGIAKSGRLTSVRLSVSRHDAVRTLTMCNAGSQARPSSITIKRTKGLKYCRYVNIHHAKMAPMPNSVLVHTPIGIVHEALPGTTVKIERRVCAA